MIENLISYAEIEKALSERLWVSLNARTQHTSRSMFGRNGGMMGYLQVRYLKRQQYPAGQ